MSYTVLARRYRSREFDELVGQEPVARTLKNAIAADRTAHAYLFCGTRGVGKTSMARIFAKAINATADLDEADEIAEAILRGDDLDVIEIDGASNRGIQEARDLIAGAGLSPARCPCKIYIIDEVHMLTREAFNALLKTMEEPPSHVKFILCTTDPQKVPATIQSRCQRFDFRAIPTNLIADQLRMILEKEGIEAEEAVVAEVARLGYGSMRDALSLLDRLMSTGEKKLTAELAEQMLGLPDQTLIAQIINAIIAGDPKAALEAGAELLNRGATVEQALELLTEHLRMLMLVSACGDDSALLEFPPDALKAAGEQAAQFDTPALVHMIAICDAAARFARGSTTARAQFDAALVRLCMSEHFADIASLLEGTASTGPAKPAGGRKKKDELSSSPRPAPKPADGGSVVEVKPAAVGDRNISDDRLWPEVLRAAATSSRDQARVQHLAFRSFDGRTLRLAVGDGGAQSARFLATQTDAVAELVQRTTGRKVRVTIDAPAAEAPARPKATAHALEEARSLPLVQKAAEIFDAMVTDVQDDPAAKGENDV